MTANPEKKTARKWLLQASAGAAKPRARRAMDTAPNGQLLWTFFVAIAVAIAALQHIFGSAPNSLQELTAAARAPGSVNNPAAGLVQYQ